MKIDTWFVQELGANLKSPATELGRRGNRFLPRGFRGVMAILACAAACLALQRTAVAQSVPPGDQGGLTLSVGGMASGYYLGYGQTKLLGATAFVDADTRRRLGFEAEARWLEYHQTANIHAETYTAGPRFSLDYGRLQPYVKGLVGIGQFNFPYNYATGNYLVIAPGGGVDYRLTHRIRIRAIDFEYQIWPQFTYGLMSSYGLSTGIRYRIF